MVDWTTSLELASVPSPDNYVDEGTDVILTCTLDSPQPSNITIIAWHIINDSTVIAVNGMTTVLRTSVTLDRGFNDVEIYCKSVNSENGKELISNRISYNVECESISYPLYPFHTTGGITRGRPHLVKCPCSCITVCHS